MRKITLGLILALAFASSSNAQPNFPIVGPGAVPCSGVDCSVLSLNLTSTNIPANGVYMSAANTLAFATNSALKATLTSGGSFVSQSNSNGWSLGAGGSSCSAVTLAPNKSASTYGIGSDGTSVCTIVAGAQVLGVAAAGLTIAGATQTLSNAAFVTCTALTTTANVLGCTVSDRRVKDNITPVMLRANFDAAPQKYTFKRGTPWYDGRAHISLIAQDVRKTYPECTPMGGTGLYQVDMPCVVAIQQGEILAMKARITKMERLLATRR